MGVFIMPEFSSEYQPNPELRGRKSREELAIEKFLKRYNIDPSELEGATKGNSNGAFGNGFMGNLVDALDNPLAAGVLSAIAPLGLTAAGIGGLWLAEEYVKLPLKRGDGSVQWVDFPPILHTLYSVLSLLIPLIIDLSEGAKEAVETVVEGTRNALDRDEDGNIDFNDARTGAREIRDIPQKVAIWVTTKAVQAWNSVF